MKPRLDKNSAVPLYRQLKGILKEAIRRGDSVRESEIAQAAALKAAATVYVGTKAKA